MGRFYDEVSVGERLPEVAQRLTVPIMVRWVGVTESVRRDHYDSLFAREHDGLPGAVMSGSFSHAYIWQLLFNWVGPDGWVLKVVQKNAKMVHPGDTFTFFGEVVAKSVVDGLGQVEVELGLRTDDGKVSVPGSATLVLPLRGGRPVPYPFVVGAGNGA